MELGRRLFDVFFFIYLYYLLYWK